MGVQHCSPTPGKSGHLDRLPTGDRNAVSTAITVYTYTVTGSTVVPPDDTKVLANVAGPHGPQPTVVLTTCTPAYSRPAGWRSSAGSPPPANRHRPDAPDRPKPGPARRRRNRNDEIVPGAEQGLLAWPSTTRPA